MTVDDAVRDVRRLLEAATGKRLTLACVEGPGGAGKSTLAQAVAAAVPGGATVVHGDDFYGPEEADWRSWSPREGYLRFFDHRRLERELLLPLTTGADGRFRSYDWEHKSLGDEVGVEARGLVIVEGVYLMRSWLRAYWDASVYVETPAEIRWARLTARGENDEGWIAAWTAAENYYLEVERPAEGADLVVPGC